MKMNEYLLMLIESKGFSIRSFAAHIEVPFTKDKEKRLYGAFLMPIGFTGVFPILVF